LNLQCIAGNFQTHLVHVVSSIIQSLPIAPSRPGRSGRECGLLSKHWISRTDFPWNNVKSWQW
jgi:hypothetical protein